MKTAKIRRTVGRPKKNTVALLVRVAPETEEFLRRKARRKNTLGMIVDRAVVALATQQLLG